ncbi:MAG: DUF1150 family protein [Alphaproteobacteria bacterium]
MDSYNNDNSYLADFESIMLETSAVAYVRPVATDQGIEYAVCSADGTQLALFSSKEAAWFAAKQHDLDPVHIH